MKIQVNNIPKNEPSLPKVKVDALDSIQIAVNLPNPFKSANSFITPSLKPKISLSWWHLWTWQSNLSLWLIKSQLVLRWILRNLERPSVTVAEIHKLKWGPQHLWGKTNSTQTISNCFKPNNLKFHLRANNSSSNNSEMEFWIEYNLLELVVDPRRVWKRSWMVKLTPVNQPSASSI